MTNEKTLQRQVRKVCMCGGEFTEKSDEDCHPNLTKQTHKLRITKISGLNDLHTKLVDIQIYPRQLHTSVIPRHWKVHAEQSASIPDRWLKIDEA